MRVTHLFPQDAEYDIKVEVAGAKAPRTEHQIEVTIIGKLDTGKDYSRTEHFAFSKGVEPKLLGVTLGSSELQLGD